MQINNVNSNQNFGMAMIIRPEVRKILAKRIESESQIKMLDSLVENQKNNPFTVDVRLESGNLKTYISDSTEGAKNQLKVIGQSIFERWFKSPLSFIEKCCNKANEMNQETYPKIPPSLKKVYEKLDTYPLLSEGKISNCKK